MENLISLICRFLAQLLIVYFPLNILISLIVGVILFFIFQKK